MQRRALEHSPFWAIVVIAIALGIVTIRLCGQARRSTSAQRQRSNPTGAGARHPIAPPPLVTLSGSVVDVAGRAILGAQVFVAQGTGPTVRRVETSPDGRFQLDAMPAGSYVVHAHTKSACSAPLDVLVRPGMAALTLTVRPGSPVEVSVVGAETGQPLAGALVSVQPLRPGGARVEQQADDQGVARLPALPVEALSVAAWAPGWSRAVRLLGPDQAGADGFRTRIALGRGLSVKGRVIDQAGAPVGGATIVYRQRTPMVIGQEQTTDAGGQFEIQGVAPGPGLLAARRAGYATTVREDLVFGARREVTLVLRPGGQVVGTVVDGDGHPVAWASVTVRSRSLAPELVAADRSGNFVVDGLPPGRVTLVAAASDAKSSPVSVEVDGSGPAPARVLRLDRSGQLNGIVLDARGHGAPGIPVRCAPEAAAELAAAGLERAVSDLDGRFEIHGLLPGRTYWLFVGPEAGISASSVAARAGDRGVRLTLALERTLRGRVVFVSGGVPRSAVVSLPRLGRRAEVDAGGGFQIEGLSLTVGRVLVRVAGPDLVERELLVPLDGGPVTDAGPLPVEPGSTLAGRVTYARGRPAQEADVIVRVPSRNRSFRIRTDEHGQFRLTVPAQSTVLVSAGSAALGWSPPVQVGPRATSGWLSIELPGGPVVATGTRR